MNAIHANKNFALELTLYRLVAGVSTVYNGRPRPGRKTFKITMSPKPNKYTITY